MIKGADMFLGSTWISIENAASKYSLDKYSVLKWVREGVVRTDQSADQSVLINVDDLELMVQEKVGSKEEQ